VFLFKFAGILTTRLSEKFVTTRFKAAESLLEEEKLPQAWLIRIRRTAFRGRWARLKPRTLAEMEEDAKEIALQLLEGLTKYFEKCPFLDTPETRLLLIDRLTALAENWRAKDWRDIVQLYAPQAAPRAIA